MMHEHLSRRKWITTAMSAAGIGGMSASVPSVLRDGLAAGRSPRPEVVAIYFPHWHRYDHMDAWKGFGWTEWELVKAAFPRFTDHHQPLRPAWGYYDDSDPTWSQKEIELAARYGVNVFLFDWYWYSGVRIMHEGLEKGFLRAPNCGDIKFALMWANHPWGDYFPFPYDEPFPVWLPQRHSEEDLLRVIEYCAEHYFSQPNYWRVNGRLFLSVFHPETLISGLGGPKATQSVLTRMDERLEASGLPGIHWNAMGADVGRAAAWSAAGFHSMTHYNLVDAGTTGAGLTQDYESLMEKHQETWETMAAAPLPYYPTVTMGWDVTPRCDPRVPFPFEKRHYPYGHVVVGNTPERFERLCTAARRYADESSHNPPAIMINAWNEWTEGSFLLPESRYGEGYLEAIRRAFAE